VRLAAVDPLNLVGIITPGPRIAALRGNLVVYRDGLPVTSAAARPHVEGQAERSASR
jgi:hypothetical protein